MASRILKIQFLLRASRSPFTRYTPVRIAPRASSRPILTARQGVVYSFNQRRLSSRAASGDDWNVCDFEKVKALVQKKNSSVILIDVREPAEFSDGHIPSALNMPITSSPDALFLTPEEFEDRFGFTKPNQNSEVIFYCKAGVRSKAAAGLAREAGFEKVHEYRGSWMDWVKNGGEKA